MKELRLFDSPYFSAVTRREYSRGSAGATTVPDGCWDLLFISWPDGRSEVIMTGAISHPIPLNFPPGTVVMNITFRPHTFVQLRTGQEMLNQGLTLRSASSRSFWLGSDALETPTFETAELFVEKMVRKGILQSDGLVAGLTGARPPVAASERSVQRHFLRTTGMTYKFFKQVRRAEEAMNLLRQGMPALQVALALGYADQSHLINSLKLLMGRTPKQIQKA